MEIDTGAAGLHNQRDHVCRVVAKECQTSASPVYGVASNLHWGGVVGERAGYSG